MRISTPATATPPSFASARASPPASRRARRRQTRASTRRFSSPSRRRASLARRASKCITSSAYVSSSTGTSSAPTSATGGGRATRARRRRFEPAVAFDALRHVHPLGRVLVVRNAVRERGERCVRVIRVGPPRRGRGGLRRDRRRQRRVSDTSAAHQRVVAGSRRRRRQSRARRRPHPNDATSYVFPSAPSRGSARSLCRRMEREPPARPPPPAPPPRRRRARRGGSASPGPRRDDLFRRVRVDVRLPDPRRSFCPESRVRLSNRGPTRPSSDRAYSSVIRRAAVLLRAAWVSRGAAEKATSAAAWPSSPSGVLAQLSPHPAPPRDIVRGMLLRRVPAQRVHHGERGADGVARGLHLVVPLVSRAPARRRPLASMIFTVSFSRPGPRSHRSTVMASAAARPRR